MLANTPTLLRQFLPVVVMLLLPVISSSVQSNTLDENILVTASRMEENAMKLPLAWSTVNSETLQFIDPIHINEIMQRVPGAWISRGNGQESIIALRSPVLTGAGGCGAFFAAADGISLRAPGFCNVNQLFDTNFEQAGRIEVIRGLPTAIPLSGQDDDLDELTRRLTSAPNSGSLYRSISWPRTSNYESE